MVNELKGEDLIFHISYGNINNEKYFNEEKRFYSQLQDGININHKGFNIFIIDDLGEIYLNEVIKIIENIYNHKNKSKDICYALINKYETKTIFLSPGKGQLFCEEIEDIKAIYRQKIFDFYNSNISKEKEEIVKNINEMKNDKIEELIKASDEMNFQVKPIENGFSFIPVKEGEMLSEINFNHLTREEKNKLLQDVEALKKLSKEIIDYIDEKEVSYTEDIRNIFKNYLSEESKIILSRNQVNDSDAVEYFNFISSEIIEEAVNEFSLKYEESYKVMEEFIEDFGAKVIFNNENLETSNVIYQDKPSFKNLFGKLEYETRNSSYVADLSMFTPGTIIKANEGCLIMNINDILYFRSVYYYLKKTFLNSRIDFDFNFETNEILPLKTINLDSIPINEKLVLIGDYNSYSILKAFDEEFSRLFPVVIQFNPFININPYNNSILKNKMLEIVKDNKTAEIEEDGITEVFKVLSRKIEDRSRFYFRHEDLKELLIKAGFYASDKNCIRKEDILKAGSSYEIYEESLYEEYLDKKILFEVNGGKVGEINGLSVIQTAVKNIGRPIKITCSKSSGEGKIFDIHKESSLSGRIHSKSINILKGYLNSLIDHNENIPVDFHLNFEQVYSIVDGDSASVAEIIAVISSLCNIKINQNIAVTGSINQFGLVQPIGSVNEKTEGFFKVCSLIDTPLNKGVLIPAINRKNLVLDDSIINSVEKGEFHIYTMDTVEDAARILLNVESMEEIKEIIKKEYKKKKSR